MNNQITSDVPVQAYARCYPGANSVSRNHRRKIVASYVPSRNVPRPVVAPTPVVKTEEPKPIVLSREERRLQKMVDGLGTEYDRLVTIYLGKGKTLEATESYVRQYLEFQLEIADSITERERAACRIRLMTLRFTPEESKLAKRFEEQQQVFNTTVKQMLDLETHIDIAIDRARIDMGCRVQNHSGLTPMQRKACTERICTLTYTGPLPQQEASTVEAVPVVVKTKPTRRGRCTNDQPCDMAPVTETEIHDAFRDLQDADLDLVYRTTFEVLECIGTDPRHTNEQREQLFSVLFHEFDNQLRTLSPSRHEAETICHEGCDWFDTNVPQFRSGTRPVAVAIPLAIKLAEAILEDMPAGQTDEQMHATSRGARQLVKLTGKSIKECKRTLKRHNGDYDAALFALITTSE